jgi:hypothetical protein
MVERLHRFRNRMLALPRGQRFLLAWASSFVAYFLLDAVIRVAFAEWYSPGAILTVAIQGVAVCWVIAVIAIWVNEFSPFR